MIFFDMDGVLADFNGYVKKHTGKNFDEHDNVVIWDILKADHARLYRDLEVLPKGLALWHHLRPLRPAILTAIPSRVTFNHSAADKVFWVGQKVENNVDVRFGPYSRDKQLIAAPGRVLIDDNPLNIEQWNRQGGLAILFDHDTADFELIHRAVVDYLKKF